MRIQQLNGQMHGFGTLAGVLLPHVSFQVRGVCIDFATVNFTETDLAGKTY